MSISRTIFSSDLNAGVRKRGPIFLEARRDDIDETIFPSEYPNIPVMRKPIKVMIPLDLKSIG